MTIYTSLLISVAFGVPFLLLLSSYLKWFDRALKFRQHAHVWKISCKFFWKEMQTAEKEVEDLQSANKNMADEAVGHLKEIERLNERLITLAHEVLATTTRSEHRESDYKLLAEISKQVVAGLKAQLEQAERRAETFQLKYEGAQTLLSDLKYKVSKQTDIRAELASSKHEMAKMNADHNHLLHAVKAVYYSACWTPDRRVPAKKLWTSLRDAAGFEPGRSPKPKAKRS